MRTVEEIKSLRRKLIYLYCFGDLTEDQKTSAASMVEALDWVVGDSELVIIPHLEDLYKELSTHRD